MKALSFTNTKSFWVSIFDAFYHSAVELIDNVSAHILIDMSGQCNKRFFEEASDE